MAVLKTLCGLAASVFLGLPEIASAHGFDLRAGDRPLPDPAARLSGQSLTFYDDGQARFFEDGRYAYTYANDGGSAFGYWRADGAEAGRICITFLNGFARCDLYVETGGRLVLLDEKGDRYPVRP